MNLRILRHGWETFFGYSKSMSAVHTRLETYLLKRQLVGGAKLPKHRKRAEELSHQQSLQQ
jgi:hypothetical protein